MNKSERMVNLLFYSEFIIKQFLSNCKQLGVYLKFLIFKLPNVSNKVASSICKKLLHRAIKKRNEEL